MNVPGDETVYSIAQLPEPQLRRIAGGSAAVFTTPNPAKDGDNEDAAALIPAGDERAVLAVADGLGGHAAGAEAARIAVDELARSIADQAAPGEPLRPAILNGIETANIRIGLLGLGAATTLAIVELDGRSLRPYHVGDSEILVVGQRGKVKLQTISHAPVAYAVEAGLMTGAEAMHHEDRNLVSNIVGSPDMRIEIGSVLRLAPRDTVLLATDGLSDNLYGQEIIDTIRRGPLGDAARRLVDDAQQRMRRPEAGKPSKPDDLTFVLYRPGAPAEPPRPASV